MAITGPTRSWRENPWVWVGIAAGGCLVILLLACVAFAVVGGLAAREVNKQVQTGTTSSWTEAAARTDLEVYEPTELPEGSGAPEIVTFGLGGLVQTVTAGYDNGLTIIEINQNPEQQSTDRRDADVPGTDEAYFSSSGQLVVRKGDTWITLSGASEAEVLDIAASLERVEE